MPGNKNTYQDAMKKASSAAWDRQWLAAIREYQRALAEFPQDPTAHAALALALQESGRLAESLQEYRVTCQLRPHDPAPLAHTAALLDKLGQVEEATKEYLQLAEMFVNLKQMNKAVEVWRRVATLAPERLDVRERLIAAYKEVGNENAAAQELMALARVHQKRGDDAYARILLQQALALDPDNSQMKVMKGELAGGVTSHATEVSDNPVERTRRSSLSRLAQTVFDGGPRWRRDAPSAPRTPQPEVDAFLTKAIDAQTHGRADEAIRNYEQALSAGIPRPEVQFNLALLYKEALRYDDAISLLKQTANDPQFALASYFAIGQICRAQGKVDAALENFVQAMKIVDLSTIKREQADQVIGVYESLAESYRAKGAEGNAQTHIQTLVNFLSGKGWEDKVREVRRHLESVAQSGMTISFAEVLEVPESERVIEALALSGEHLKQGHPVAATDEALNAIELAPEYLPSHVHLAEIFVQTGRTLEAREKYEILAETANVRGEITKAISFYRHALALEPDDLTRRAKLIDLLVGYGQLAEALNEFLELGALLDHSGQLQQAIEKYAEGIRLAQRAGVVGSVVPTLRNRLAEAYVKAHDWTNALPLYQEMRAAAPADERVQFIVTDLFLRLGQHEQGERELDDLLSHCVNAPNKTRAILATLARNLPDDVPVNLRLAHTYSAAGQREKAIETLDVLGDRLLNAGQSEAAIRVIREIIALNPPRSDDYRKLLEELGASS